MPGQSIVCVRLAARSFWRKAQSIPNLFPSGSGTLASVTCKQTTRHGSAGSRRSENMLDRTRLPFSYTEELLGDVDSLVGQLGTPEEFSGLVAGSCSLPFKRVKSLAGLRRFLDRYYSRILLACE